EAAGERVAVDTRDGGFAQLRHFQEEVREVAPLKISVELGNLERKALQVGPGAEHGAGAGQDDDANRLVALRLLERLAKLFDGVGAGRVAVVRAIDGDRGDRVTAPPEEVFELHRLKYMARHFALRHPLLECNRGGRRPGRGGPHAVRQVGRWSLVPDRARPGRVGYQGSPQPRARRGR